MMSFEASGLNMEQVKHHAGLSEDEDEPMVGWVTSSRQGDTLDLLIPTGKLQSS